jgi:hypothetical protein
MISDTEKLVKLVSELEAEIGSSSSAALTTEQLRKLAEIEKLAHSVKEKMKYTAPTPEINATTRVPLADVYKR